MEGGTAQLEEAFSANQWRRAGGGGAKEAERFIGGLAKTPNEQVVSSHVHDAMKTDHGRDSRRVFFFLGNLSGDLSREVPLLVSDIGSGCQHR